MRQSFALSATFAGCAFCFPGLRRQTAVSRIEMLASLAFSAPRPALRWDTHARVLLRGSQLSVSESNREYPPTGRPLVESQHSTCSRLNAEEGDFGLVLASYLSQVAASLLPLKPQTSRSAAGTAALRAIGPDRYGRWRVTKPPRDSASECLTPGCADRSPLLPRPCR